MRLRLTPRSRPLLRGEERIRLREDPAAKRAAKRAAKTAPAHSYQVPAEDEPSVGGPARLAHDAVPGSQRPALCHLSRCDAQGDGAITSRPSPSELLAVQGVGETKLERYGASRSWRCCAGTGTASLHQPGPHQGS